MATKAKKKAGSQITKAKVASVVKVLAGKDEDDTELWEGRKLGADPRYAKRSSREDEAEINASIDAALLQPISIRLPPELIAHLKTKAKKIGMGYQTLARKILIEHANDDE